MLFRADVSHANAVTQPIGYGHVKNWQENDINVLFDGLMITLKTSICKIFIKGAWLIHNLLIILF